MKSTIQLFCLMAVAGSLTVIGCNENTQEKIESTTDSIASKVEQGVDNLGNRVDSAMNENADENFLSDAVEANTLELRALKLGQQKGGKDVKSNAAHMLADHKKLGAEVTAYVKKKNLALRDVDTADTDNDLGDRAAGKDFDKAWADKMVNDHEKVIDMFEDAQDDVKDSELKEMISSALPKLKAHLEMSKKLQSQLSGNAR